ncbi:Myb-like_DNA-binding domain-containing protein [Hexamita inflata]|uniref:Myb-like DNA-binding domain-containing protein n=1 Tax=Hexamita inflata TaxID=28002 RepID=A0AA86NSA6_9EUKA|nr:Myb-like DNA-binding domain-containing protein [Hexamita inflata]CAI9966726.1 Myb-like DNA-binding domain-containing protein [Hexamita inflata]
MFLNHKYATWSDAEIRKLIDATNIHKDKTIDWIGVASHFPGRTPQQCKSFYNNRVKPLKMKTNSMVNDYYLFMISTQMQKPRTPTQNAKKLFCECGTADMFIYIVNLLADNIEFKFNAQFMGVIVEIIEIYQLVSEYLKTEFIQKNYVEVGEYVVSKEMYEIMALRMASFDATAVIQKIQDQNRQNIYETK